MDTRGENSKFGLMSPPIAAIRIIGEVGFDSGRRRLSFVMT